MIIDTSALLGILLGETDATRCERAIAAGRSRCSKLRWLWRDAAAGQALDDLLGKASVEIVAVTAGHAAAARRAWRRFGKGNHPAAPNFGDCFACALAEESGEPLLFKGSDFARTDVEVALPSLENDES